MVENNQNSPEKVLKTLIGVLAAVAVVLAGALGYIWYNLSQEKKALTEEMALLKSDYDGLSKEYEGLSSSYDEVTVQLDSSRMVVTELLDRIQKTNAANRAQMRRYEKELGTLRSVMKTYVVQIDSLHTLNQQLTADAAAARQEAANTRKEAEKLTREVKTLEGQVATGSKMRARDIRLEAFNSSDKITDRSSRVVRLVTSLSLIENSLAAKGPVTVYIRVFVTPKDGGEEELLSAGASQTFTVGDSEPMLCSAFREVDYQGDEIEMAIYMNFNKDQNLPGGVYRVEVYTKDGKLGDASIQLR